MSGNLTIRSSRDRFAAAELFGKLSQRRGRKALRLNSGVSAHDEESSSVRPNGYWPVQLRRRREQPKEVEFRCLVRWR